MTLDIELEKDVTKCAISRDKLFVNCELPPQCHEEKIKYFMDMKKLAERVDFEPEIYY